MDTSKIAQKFNAVEEAKPIEATKRELTEEAKQFITDTCKTVIFDVIPKDELDNYMYLVNVSTNPDTNDYDAPLLFLFKVPTDMNRLVCVNTIRIDLNTRRITTPPVLFGPIVIRKDKNGIERDAVILSRFGDISITFSNLTSSIAPQKEIDEYYAKKDLEGVDIEEMLAMNDLDK